MDSVFQDGLSFALPLLIIAIGGIYSERSGVTNLALEGLLGFGAFFGALFVYLFGAKLGASSMYLSFIAAIIGGMIPAALHALLCVNFKANQVISGVVINIISLAVTVFLTRQIGDAEKFVLPTSVRFDIPLLSKIPILGAAFRRVYPFELIILALVFLTWFLLNKTRFGMRLRACGDNPNSVDSAGINVSRIRFIAVLISGALSGIGGLCFAYSIFSQFSASVFFGAGYLAIAALIFGNWRIGPAIGACFLFAFAKSGGIRFTYFLGMPAAFTKMLDAIPYLLTLIVLIFFSKSNRAPRALGEIYDKGKR